MADLTKKPRPPRRSARKSLIRLVTDYAPGVPFLAALLAAQPEPKAYEPVKPRDRGQRGGGVASTRD